MVDKDCGSLNNIAETPPMGIQVGLLTGGFDRPYAFSMAMALASKGVSLDVIGSHEVDRPEMHTTPKLKFFNFQSDPRQRVSLMRKALRIMMFYGRLIGYAASAKPKIFHILWNHKIQLFDRTVLMLYYKLLGKKITFTAHNVNAGRRDANDSALNRWSLRIQYRLADHIFVHTEKMKGELIEEFGIRKEAVTVVPHGINNDIPHTDLTPAEAKRRLGIARGDRTILFFGAIRPYKGLEHLVAAFHQVAPRHEGYRLIIAGEPKKQSLDYLRDIQENLDKHPSRERVMQKIEFIPDNETELYFKAADVLVLPYTVIFQSGVLFLAYSFGLPVIAADVGSFADDIIPGETGYLFRPCDAADLASTIEAYFESDLFKSLDRRRQGIRDYASGRNSWEVVATKICNVYVQLLRRKS
jgi:glycosyltransferase involved in cell wall biosynthesis